MSRPPPSTTACRRGVRRPGATGGWPSSRLAGTGASNPIPGPAGDVAVPAAASGSAELAGAPSSGYSAQIPAGGVPVCGPLGRGRAGAPVVRVSMGDSAGYVRVGGPAGAGRAGTTVGTAADSSVTGTIPGSAAAEVAVVEPVCAESRAAGPWSVDPGEYFGGPVPDAVGFPAVGISEFPASAPSRPVEPEPVEPGAWRAAVDIGRIARLQLRRRSPGPLPEAVDPGSADGGPAAGRLALSSIRADHSRRSVRSGVLPSVGCPLNLGARPFHLFT